MGGARPHSPWPPYPPAAGPMKGNYIGPAMTGALPTYLSAYPPYLPGEWGYANYANYANSGKKILISRSADSGESEPCTMFCATCRA
jgi:hypothetical protein